MLEYIWFFVLMTTSIVLADRGARKLKLAAEDSINGVAETILSYLTAVRGARKLKLAAEDSINGVAEAILSYLAASLAVALSWGRTGEVLTGYLLTHLPEAGYGINHFTTFVIVTIAAFSFAGGIPTFVMWVAYHRTKRSSASVTRENDRA